MLHSTYEEDDSNIQSICKVVLTDLSSLFTKQESYALISSSDHNADSCKFHSTNHFPTSISNDICSTSFDIYDLSSQYSDTCQAVEEH